MRSSDQPGQRNGSRRQSQKRTAAANSVSRSKTRGGPHLIRAVHDASRITRWRLQAPVRSRSSDDVARKVSDRSLTADVLRFEGKVTNSTAATVPRFTTLGPWRTQMNDHNFAFYLPEGAERSSSPRRKAPTDSTSKRRHTADEKKPLRDRVSSAPGETAVQVEYTMPLLGIAKVDPSLCIRRSTWSS